jgi:hypothetical protein
MCIAGHNKTEKKKGQKNKKRYVHRTARKGLINLEMPFWFFKLLAFSQI